MPIRALSTAEPLRGVPVEALRSMLRRGQFPQPGRLDRRATARQVRGWTVDNVDETSGQPRGRDDLFDADDVERIGLVTFVLWAHAFGSRQADVSSPSAGGGASATRRGHREPRCSLVERMFSATRSIMRPTSPGSARWRAGDGGDEAFEPKVRPPTSAIM